MLLIIKRCIRVLCPSGRFPKTATQVKKSRKLRIIYPYSMWQRLIFLSKTIPSCKARRLNRAFEAIGIGIAMGPK